MFIDSLTASTSVATNSTLLNPLQVNTTPTVLLPNVQSIGATYSSDLRVLDVNWLLPIPIGLEDYPVFDHLQLFAGFGFVEFYDQMHARLNGPPQVFTFTYDVITHNRLYGLQAGATETSCLGRWRLETGLKLGIFHNNADQSSALNTVTALTQAAGSTDRVAFVGELGVRAEFPICSYVSLHAGYDLFWIETAALAGEQIPATDFFAETGVDADGGVFFHGATLGMSYWY